MATPLKIDHTYVHGGPTCRADLGRAWHTMGGLADNHPLTHHHNRPVGATTGWQQHREHQQARAGANRLLHLLGNMCDPSRLATRLDLRIDVAEGLPTIEGIQHIVKRPALGNSTFWLAGEAVFMAGAYVAIARQGASLEGWETFAQWLRASRRDQQDVSHVRFYLQL